MVDTMVFVVALGLLLTLFWLIWWRQVKQDGKLQHVVEMLEELAEQLKPVELSALLEEAKEIAGRLEKKNLQPLAKRIHQAIQANLGYKIAVSVLAKGEGCLIEEVRQAARDSRQLKYIRDQEHEYIGIKE